MTFAAVAGLPQAVARCLGFEKLPQVEGLDKLGQQAGLDPVAQPAGLRKSGAMRGAQAIAFRGNALHARFHLVALHQGRGDRQYGRKSGQADEKGEQAFGLYEECEVHGRAFVRNRN